MVAHKENRLESGNSRGGVKIDDGVCVLPDEIISKLRASCQIRTYSEAEKDDVLRRYGIKRVKSANDVGTERKAQRTENFATYRLGVPYGGRADLT